MGSRVRTKSGLTLPAIWPNEGARLFFLAAVAGRTGYKAEKDCKLPHGRAGVYMRGESGAGDPVVPGRQVSARIYGKFPTVTIGSWSMPPTEPSVAKTLDAVQESYELVDGAEEPNAA